MPLFFTYFTRQDTWLIVSAILLGTSSLFFFIRGKMVPAVLLLTGAAFLLRLTFVLCDPYLHPWDEQIHALVAKNLAAHPFKPTLLEDPVLYHDPANWTSNYIWLHKPPFFLWLMAVSIKLFGTTPFAVRLPSLLLTTLLIPVIYRMVRLLLNSKQGGYLAALLFASASYQLHLACGQESTDHNDLIFIALVAFSFWALTEWVYTPAADLKKRNRYAILCGLFSGFAVLTKYLPGMLPLGTFGLYLLLDKPTLRNPGAWLQAGFAAGITMLLFMSWHMYSVIQWPEEYKIVSSHFSDHLKLDLGHPGPWWYHFEQITEQYGWVFAFAIVPGLVLLLWQSEKPRFVVALLVTLFIVYGFYSFVPIRMPQFPGLIGFMLFAGAASSLLLFIRITEKIKWRWLSGSLLMVVLLKISFNNMDLEALAIKHYMPWGSNIYRTTRTYNRYCYEQAEKMLPAEKYNVFNCGTFGAPAMMFYTSCKTAYDFVPDESTITLLKEHKILIVVFDDGKLPDYIRNDSTIMLLHQPLLRNGN